MFENLRRTQSGGHRAYETPPGTPDERYRSNNRRNSKELTGYFRKPSSERAESPPPQPLRNSLTQALLDSTPEKFEAATQHPFLQRAGEGKLSKHKLSSWLSQDRLYAEAYVSFITSLIARVVLPYTFVTDKSKSLRWRILNLLTGCLTNIQNEIEFFTKTAQEYDLQLDVVENSNESDYFGPNAITDQYITLFRSFHLDPQQTLLEGLLILWATEKCYLEAWSHASTFLSKDGQGKDDADGGALRNSFIPNWSSDEFGGFVKDIADVTDELAQREGALRKIEVFKALWLHVLEIEKGFWPDVE